MPAEDERVRRILSQARRIAVVGLSNRTDRASHRVASYLQQQGYQVIPVNPRLAGQRILGEACVARLLDVNDAVDLVDVFRRTEDVLPIAQEAVQIGAKCLWQQLDIANAEADALVRGAGLESVMNRCTKIEHARLLGD